MLKAFLATVLTSILVVAAFICDARHPAFGYHSASSVVVVSNGLGHGSGVYIGQGLIVTAGHVAKMADKDGKLSISNIKYVSAPATVVWFDEIADVGLLKLDGPAIPNLRSADLACGAPDATAGAEIEVIGNPLNLTNILTWGHVAGNAEPRFDTKQISLIGDVTVAPGNSGGPVFDVRGKIAGIAVGTAMQPGGGTFPLAYIIPRSVICKLMAEPHAVPTFADNTPQAPVQLSTPHKGKK